MQAWYSLVTTAPADLLPIQRLPHVDGTDPAQIAMMLDLHRTGPTNTHGRRAFFRHRSTGLEALTADSFPTYARALQDDVAKDWLAACGLRALIARSVAGLPTREEYVNAHCAAADPASIAA